MKTKLTFQLIKYIAIIFFIYVILIFFNILPNNETNTDINNQSNINKLKKLEAVCPLTIFNPNKLSVNDFNNIENIANPDISNSKIQLNNQTNKIHYCSVKEDTNIKSNKQCTLGNVYLDIEKCNSLM